MKPGATGLQRIWHACGYSWQGLCAAFRHESAFRQELALFIIAIPLAYIIGETPLEWLFLLGSILLLLIIELLNSAIEACIDRIGHERHELSGRAKDLGSAAVFLGVLLMIFTWLVIGFF